ncbi:MAG: energy-coupling factor ABC transporter ATP-binding protein [Lachnospiraceae bacterium]|nr:energy-coupling factor ABC transporter ATP-binding protein [Lachnospiraceae bacterium]
MIDIKNLIFEYDRGIRVLDNISLSCKNGESVGLVGANGAGKSTLLKLLVGIADKYEGEIKVDGLDVNKKNISKIREKTGYVFQDYDSQLFMPKVVDDVAFAPVNYGFAKEEVDRRVDKALTQINIEHLRDRHIYKLSGGEKKLVSIATILSMEPEIILMDEPSIALDPKNRRNLINILNNLGQLKIIASHDLDMIMDTCKRTVLLSGGRIAADGDTREVLSDKELLESAGLELPLRLQK